MARTTIAFDRDTLRAALKDHTPREIGDSGIPGLCLRIRQSSAVWSLRGRLHRKQSTWRIGSAEETPVSVARELAGAAKQMLRRGEDPGIWLREQELGGPITPPPAPEPEVAWPWERLRDAYFEAMTGNLRAHTVRSYRQALFYPVVTDTLGGRDIFAITDQDIQKIRDDIRAAGKYAQSAACMRTLKACFSWATEDTNVPLRDPPGTRVRPVPRGGHASKPKANAGRADDAPARVPSIGLLGRAAAKLRATDLPPGARLAALLTLYSAQRRLTVASAAPSNFEEMPEAEGWMIWHTGHTKKQRDHELAGHILPLPPRAAEIVRTALASTANASWLFPQARLRRRGDGGGKYADESMITKAFREANLGFTPHGVRRAFATHLEKRRGIIPAETKLILDHAEGLSGDITATHYALHDNLNPKRRVLAIWIDFLEECERAVNN